MKGFLIPNKGGEMHEILLPGVILSHSSFFKKKLSMFYGMVCFVCCSHGDGGTEEGWQQNDSLFVSFPAIR